MQHHHYMQHHYNTMQHLLDQTDLRLGSCMHHDLVEPLQQVTVTEPVHQPAALLQVFEHAQRVLLGEAVSQRLRQAHLQGEGHAMPTQETGRQVAPEGEEKGGERKGMSETSVGSNYFLWFWGEMEKSLVLKHCKNQVSILYHNFFYL